FWLLQAIGLMQVTLGCLLASDAVFGVLLVAYLASGVWCLALFNLYQDHQTADGNVRTAGPNQPSLFNRQAATPDVPWRALGLGRVLRWTAVVAILGGLLFLAVPRTGNTQWNPFVLAPGAQPRSQTGIESGIDLNRIGTIEVSREVSF